MFTIGDFARLAGVSVRMLRHYDAIGLLVPAEVDPFTSHRRYSAAQLPRANRLVALKDLGFSLDRLGPVLDESVSAEQLRGMLRLRSAELTAELAATADRLESVERRLHLIEKEPSMSTTTEVRIETMPSVLVASRGASVDDIDGIAGVIGPMFDALAGDLGAARTPIVGPSIATYRSNDDGTVQLTAAFGVPAGSAAPDDATEVTELPAHPRAAVTVHVGGMDTVGETWQLLATWIESAGEKPAALPCREVYRSMEMSDPQSWVTELQWPLR